MPAEQIDPRRPNMTDVDVGHLVRVHRMARGISQTELGNHIGVTFQQVQKYEAGTNRISMGRLTRIAQVLGVKVTYLLAGSRQAAPAYSSNRQAAKLAEATRMLGRIGALRLLKAFLALPTRPPQLQESILRLVEGTALAVQRKASTRNMTRRRVGEKRVGTRRPS
jgi:transcriptional regulator with XRE-family HTH domain